MLSTAEVQRVVAEARDEVAAMSPQECMATAAFVREMQPSFRTPHQREIAEEMAQRFERQAVAKASDHAS
jgi:hypothetical protein